MGSILEKVTLYDFLGYLVPGLVFLTIVLFCPVADMNNVETLNIYNTGIFTAIFLLAGFTLGILLSEISRIIFSVPFCFRRFRNFYYKIVLKKSGLETEVIKQALINSRFMLTPSSDNIQDIAQYCRTMYGDIQIDEQYKRIHNYASAESMYKNLSCAFLIGGAIFWLHFNCAQHLPGWVFCFIWWGGVLLFARRHIRFHLKKDLYTLVWFVRKYLT